MRNQSFKKLLGVLSAAVLMGAAIYAQDAPTGKVKIHVTPGEAYTFVDGQGYGPGNHTLTLAAGEHQILIANYGFTFHHQAISLEPNGTAAVDAALQPSGGLVAGPRGRIQIELGNLNAGDDAVLLNGQTPAYFVGHIDEYNNELFTKQELIVPPGTHLVTITKHGQVRWSGKLNIGENERVIVDISNGKEVVKKWDRGTELGELGRFKAGIASATVVIAPVSGSITATPSTIDCNQSSRLAWTSAETIDADISGFSPVPVSGERTVSPKETTTYEFTATGPGGVTKSSTTVQVNPVVSASLTASPTEVQYRRVGGKVIEQGSTTLNWSTTNADAASIASLGTVAASGTQTVAPVPTRTGVGPVNEDMKYTINASNVCGGSEMKTVAVHLTGSIDSEPTPAVALRSVFFPTDYPRKDKPTIGLLGSQRQALTMLAAGFNEYLQHDPDGKLALVAHADTRGPESFNMKLAERRAQVVKEFLVAQGIAEDKVTVSARGEQEPLDEAVVAQLESQNPEPAPAARARKAATMQFAYQRRVDIGLLPTNAESVRFYPNGAPDSEILWQRVAPPLSAIEKE